MKPITLSRVNGSRRRLAKQVCIAKNVKTRFGGDMIRQDFLLRLIEQLGVFFQRVLNKNVSSEETDAGINALFDEWIGLPSGMLLSLPAEESYRLFDESARMVAEKCYLMAEVCRAKGLLSEGEDERRQYYEKALFFYSKCSDSGDEKLQQEIDKHVAALTAAVA